MQTNFNEIDFNPNNHTYKHLPTGQVLTSVTKKVSQVKPPFDAPKVAARVVAKKGGTVEALLAEWDKAREAGFALGKKVHSHIESVLRGVESQAGDPFLALNGACPEIAAFDRLWNKLRPTVEVKQVEWVIGDVTLGLAGTCDTLLWNPDGETFHIWDWKTGKKFETGNPWENMLAPFGHHSSCELVHYSLQTSLYRLIIERNTPLRLGDSYLVHLASTGEYQVHRALDLRAELLAWLAVQDE
jgi:hypothetical protein